MRRGRTRAVAAMGLLLTAFVVAAPPVAAQQDAADMVVRSLDFGGGAVAAGGTIDLTLEFGSRGPANVARGPGHRHLQQERQRRVTATNSAISCSGGATIVCNAANAGQGVRFTVQASVRLAAGAVRQPDGPSAGQLQPARPCAGQQPAPRQRADLVHGQPRAHAVDRAEPAPGGRQRHHPADRHQQRSVPRRQRRDLRQHPGRCEPRLGQWRVQPRRRSDQLCPGPPRLGCLGDRPDHLRARRARGGLTGDGGGHRALLHPRSQRREQLGRPDVHGRCRHGRRQHPEVGQPQPSGGGWDGDLLDGGEQRRPLGCPGRRRDRSATCRSAPGRRPGAGLVRAARPHGHLQRGHARSRRQRHGRDQRGGLVECAARSAREPGDRQSETADRNPGNNSASVSVQIRGGTATARTTGTTRPRSTVAPTEASQTTTTLPGELPATGGRGAPLGAASILLAVGVVLWPGLPRPPSLSPAQLAPARRYSRSRPARWSAGENSSSMRSRPAWPMRNALSGLSRKRRERLGHRLRVIGGHELAVDAGPDQLGRAAEVGGDDRHAVGHRLEDGERLVLVPA